METCNTYNMLKLTRHFSRGTAARGHGFLRTRALQPHPRLAGPGQGHVRLPDVAQTGPFQDLFDAGEFILVLRGNRDGKSRQIRGHHLFSQRQVIVCEFVHPVRIVVAGKGRSVCGRNQIPGK